MINLKIERLGQEQGGDLTEEEASVKKKVIKYIYLRGHNSTPIWNRPTRKFYLDENLW